jgi:hypothetical protein
MRKRDNRGFDRRKQDVLSERIGHPGRSDNVGDSFRCAGCGVLKRLKIVCRNTHHRIRTGQPDAAGRLAPKGLELNDLTKLPVVQRIEPLMNTNGLSWIHV